MEESRALAMFLVGVWTMAIILILLASGIDNANRGDDVMRIGEPSRKLRRVGAGVDTGLGLFGALAVMGGSATMTASFLGASAVVFTAYGVYLAVRLRAGQNGACGCGVVSAPTSVVLVSRNAVVASLCVASSVWLVTVSANDGDLFAGQGTSTTAQGMLAAVALAACVIALPAALAAAQHELQDLAQENSLEVLD